MPPLTPDLPLTEVSSRAAWRAWLISHADSSRGVWALTVKKSALEPGEEYVSARDVNDERHTALLCTPRKPGSGWSKVNKERLAPLIEAGLATPRGLASIAAAKADGSWPKLDEVDALVVPDDLANALDSIPDARRNFDASPPSARGGILEWIQNAQRAETRHKRVAETAELAGQNRRALQWPRTQ